MGAVSLITYVASVEELTKKKGASMAQISLAWIMAKPGVSAPIIGTTNLSNLEDVLGQWASVTWLESYTDSWFGMW